MWDEIIYPFPNFDGASLVIDMWFHPTRCNGRNYLSMLGLKLIHVSKKGAAAHQGIHPLAASRAANVSGAIAKYVSSKSLPRSRMGSVWVACFVDAKFSCYWCGDHIWMISFPQSRADSGAVVTKFDINAACPGKNTFAADWIKQRIMLRDEKSI